MATLAAHSLVKEIMGWTIQAHWQERRHLEQNHENNTQTTHNNPDKYGGRKPNNAISVPNTVPIVDPRGPQRTMKTI